MPMKDTTAMKPMVHKHHRHHKPMMAPKPMMTPDAPKS
jgi:hypothetical protein